MAQITGQPYICDFKPITFRKEVFLNERHVRALDRLLEAPRTSKRRFGYTSKKLDLYLQNPPKKSPQRVLISISAK